MADPKVGCGGLSLWAVCVCGGGKCVCVRVPAGMGATWCQSLEAAATQVALVRTRSSGDQLHTSKVLCWRGVGEPRQDTA
jgi:hypothetical protein